MSRSNLLINLLCSIDEGLIKLPKLFTKLIQETIGYMISNKITDESILEDLYKTYNSYGFNISSSYILNNKYIKFNSDYSLYEIKNVPNDYNLINLPPILEIDIIDNDESKIASYDQFQNMISINIDNVVKYYESGEYIFSIHNIIGTVNHEITHYVQFKSVIRSDKRQMGSNSSSDTEKYNQSSIEFDPKIKSEIGRFKTTLLYSGSNKITRNVKTKFIQNFINNSPFFKAIKSDIDKYKRAVKYFTIEVSKFNESDPGNNSIPRGTVADLGKIPDRPLGWRKKSNKKKEKRLLKFTNRSESIINLTEKSYIDPRLKN